MDQQQEESSSGPDSLTGIVEIPLHDSDENIEVEVAKVPPSELMEILKRECPPVSVWYNAAIEYYKQNVFDGFVLIADYARQLFLECRNNAEQEVSKILDSLGAYYVQLATKERNRDRKKYLLQQASQAYSTSDVLNMYDQTHVIARAFCYLIEGVNIEFADSQFNFVLRVDENSVPALLGKACISYYKKDIKGAIALFRKVLRIYPQVPAEVRVGLGLCLLKLGSKEAAELAFLRALELNPYCVPALTAMAIFYINVRGKETIRKGVQLLSRAYICDQSNAVVLNHLADHFFFKKELPRAKHLALHAFHNAENDTVRAESCYQLARCFHVQEDYDYAFQYYYQASQFAGGKFVLANFALGQMYIQRHDYPNAIQYFEKLLKQEPDNLETLKILSALFIHSGDDKKRNMARTYLKKVTMKCPNDYEAWIDLGFLLEKNEPTESLKSYMAAVKFLNQSAIPVPAEVYNNIGSLNYRQGNYREARHYFEECLTCCKADMEVGVSRSTMETSYLSSLEVTATFNLARVMEVICNYGEAEKMYKEILKEHPNYLDCYLRLGCAARDYGQIYEASDWFKDALQLSNEHPDAWTLIGNLHLSKAEWQPGQKKFERIIHSRETANDSYATIALANIWLQTLNLCGKDVEKRKRHQERAMQFYKQVLRNEPKNIWAANGIACVLAYTGFISEARTIFKQVREATADFPGAWLNIAHIYVEENQCNSAVQMYENCIRRFYRYHHVDILQYLARAYFRHDKLREAKQALLKARRVNPTETILLFNLALVLQKLATEIFKNDKSNLQLVLSAVRELALAHKYFQYLSVNGDKNKYDLNHANAEGKRCQDLLSQAQYHVARARKVDEEERNLRKKHQEEQEAYRLRKIEEQKRQEEEKSKQVAEMLRKREEFKKERQNALLFLEPSPEKGPKKRERKSSASSVGSGDEKVEVKPRRKIKRQFNAVKSFPTVKSDI